MEYLPDQAAAGAPDGEFVAFVPVDAIADADDLLFLDPGTGGLVAQVAVEGVSIGPGPAGGAFERVVKRILVPGGRHPREIEEDWLRLTYRVQSKIRDRTLGITLDLEPAKPIDETWRTR